MPPTDFYPDSFFQATWFLFLNFFPSFFSVFLYHAAEAEGFSLAFERTSIISYHIVFAGQWSGVPERDSRLSAIAFGRGSRTASAEVAPTQGRIHGLKNGGRMTTSARNVWGGMSFFHRGEAWGGGMPLPRFFRLLSSKWQVLVYSES